MFFIFFKLFIFFFIFYFFLFFIFIYFFQGSSSHRTRGSSSREAPLLISPSCRLNIYEQTTLYNITTVRCSVLHTPTHPFISSNPSTFSTMLLHLSLTCVIIIRLSLTCSTPMCTHRCSGCVPRHSM